MDTEPLVALDPAWPKMTLADAEAALTVAGGKFEIETVEIDGVPTRVWKHAPPSLAVLISASRMHGDRVFTIYEDERVSYAANFRAVAKLAHVLVGMGIAKGDRVGLAMRNLPEWPVIFFAATSIGAIVVPLNAWWTSGELEYGIDDAGCRILFVDDERYQRLAADNPTLPALETMVVARASGPLDPRAMRLEDLIGTPHDYAALPDAELPPVDLLPEDSATIFYTSGTTGNPKGALGSHRNLMSNILTSAFSGARSYLRRGEAVPDPQPRTYLTVVPLFHVTACSATMMGSVAAGNTLIFMRKWDAVRAMEIIETEKVHATGGVPTIAWQILEHPDRAKYDLSSLELIAYGGAPSAPELVRRIYTEFGALPSNGWGMTETMATVTGHGGEDYLARPTSAGPPVPVADLKIMDEAGEVELPLGEVGELWARGPMIVKGYWNKPEATAATFVHGWVRTGDLARLDEEGFVYIVDRAKDMIIRGGENIYSSEVENVLYAHPAVTDCALIGLPHRTLGEEPAAVVHLAPGMEASEAELQAWVKARLAIFKTPVAIRFVQDTLPRNANGKILKKDLKVLFEDRVGVAA